MMITIQKWNYFLAVNHANCVHIHIHWQRRVILDNTIFSFGAVKEVSMKSIDKERKQKNETREKPPLFKKTQRRFQCLRFQSPHERLLPMKLLLVSIVAERCVCASCLLAIGNVYQYIYISCFVCTVRTPMVPLSRRTHIISQSALTRFIQIKRTRHNRKSHWIFVVWILLFSIVTLTKVITTTMAESEKKSTEKIY